MALARDGFLYTPSFRPRLRSAVAASKTAWKMTNNEMKASSGGVTCHMHQLT